MNVGTSSSDIRSHYSMKIYDVFKICIQVDYQLLQENFASNQKIIVGKYRKKDGS